MRSTSLIAECACRECAIELTGDPVLRAVCHCDNCKRRTGSAFSFAAYFRKSDVARVRGEMTLYALHNASRNEDQERYFCSRCGTTLYWYLSSYPDYIGVAGGCFPNDSLGEPTISSSTAQKLGWVAVPANARVTE